MICDHRILLQADKHAITQKLGVQLRDLRLLDPQLHFSYPSALLCRDKALVVNLEHIKCIITKDEVFILNADEDPVVWLCVPSLFLLPSAKGTSWLLRTPCEGIRLCVLPLWTNHRLLHQLLNSSPCLPLLSAGQAFCPTHSPVPLWWPDPPLMCQGR